MKNFHQFLLFVVNFLIDGLLKVDFKLHCIGKDLEGNQSINVLTSSS